MRCTICKSCGNKVPAYIKVDGKEKNMCSRRHCVDCVPFGESRKRKREDSLVCTQCNRAYPYSRARRNGATQKLCNSCVVKNRQHRLKDQAMAMLGGACALCGYSKCRSALDFHHKDTSEKEFNIGAKWNHSWETIEREVRKCVLLCCRCHAEVHASVATIT